MENEGKDDWTVQEARVNDTILNKTTELMEPVEEGLLSQR